MCNTSYPLSSPKRTKKVDIWCFEFLWVLIFQVLLIKAKNYKLCTFSQIDGYYEISNLFHELRSPDG